MVIPPERLTEYALLGLIESFITREGTDYGDMELSLSDKVSSLMPLVIKGEMIILYDDISDSINLVSKRDYDAMESQKASS